ncbi:MAG: hypothetical protein IKQ34_04635 [Bacilli bacterium]|nr:hypothetical protein [Bacilli bacterium]MBR6056465.1 hypothetical protein [Bacilli bacterium]
MAGVDEFKTSEINPSCANEMNQDVQKTEWSKIHLFGAYSRGDYTKVVHRIGLVLIGGTGVAILTSAAAISMMNKMDAVKPVFTGAYEDKVAKVEGNIIHYDFDAEYKIDTTVYVELSQANQKLQKETYTCLYDEEKDNHMEIAGDFSLVKGHYDLRVYADFTYGKTLMITYSGYLEE